MSIYTVHQPPLGAAEALPDPERFAFVRDGFSVWAFLVAALWMLWHRMWLVLAIYVAAAACLDAVMYYAGIPDPVVVIVGFCGSLLVGIEASTLRRFALARQGWKNVGVVSGHDQEDAEQRFFDAWVGPASGKRAEPPARPSSPPPAPAPHMPPSLDVIGLFPEPGGAGR